MRAVQCTQNELTDISPQLKWFVMIVCSLLKVRYQHILPIIKDVSCSWINHIAMTNSSAAFIEESSF